MKRLCLLVASCALTFALQSAPNTPESGTWIDQNNLVQKDESWRKSKDGFAVMLVLTRNQNAFKDWAKPETPAISQTSAAAINTPVLPLVLFSNPKLDDKGCVNVTFDIKITRPDGSVSHEYPNLPCLIGALKGPAQNVYLGNTEIVWKAEPGDPLGLWTFAVTVYDKNRGVAIPLETTLEIKP